MVSRLKEAIQALHNASASLAGGNDSLMALSFRIEALTVDEVSVKTRPSLTDAALISWNEYIQSKKSALTAREIKHLCWEPRAALDDRFVDLVKKQFGSSLSRRCQIGFIYCCATSWDTFAGEKQLSKVLRAYLFDESNFSFIKKVQYYLNPDDGIARFIKDKIQLSAEISESLKSTFGLILEGTQYASAIRMEIGILYSEFLFSESFASRDWLYSEILKKLEKKHVVSIIAKSVVNKRSAPSELVLHEFRDFLLDYKELGDPRADGGMFKWKGVPESVRQKVSEWFSQEDIRVFFDVFFDEGNDTQGRKEFWIQYAYQVQRTRVLVCQNDLGKRNRLSKNMRQSSTVGTLKDGDGSAFVMDFGSLLVVEFSRANNACYFYLPDSKASVVGNFWSPIFRSSELKDRDVGRHFPHHHQVWQKNFIRELALLGLRPREG